MKPSNDNSFPRARRSFLMAAFAVLLGSSLAVGQTSGTSSSGTSGTSGTTGSSSTRDRSGSTSTQPGSYGTGSTRNGASSAESTTSGTTGTSPSSSATTGTGRSTDTTGGASTMTGRDMGTGKLGFMDRRFVSKSAESGAVEVSLAELATQQATNPEVKSFAQTLVQDHTKVNDALTAMASQRQVDLDKDDPKQERAYKKLAKKSGSEFDQEFVEHMIDSHEASVKRFEKAAKDAKDPAVRSFASQHVDHLRQHLEKAQSLRQAIMPTGRDESTRGSSPSSIDSSSTPGASSSSSSSTSPSSSSSTSPSSSSSSTSADPTSSSSGTTGSGKGSKSR